MPTATTSVASGSSAVCSATRRAYSATALLLIDFVNPLLDSTGPRFVNDVIRAARNAAELKRKARRARMPIIYANDNFGNWQSSFPTLLAQCRQNGSAGKPVMLLEPRPDDYAILKPRHSAFYGTPLEFLLDELHVSQLILAGIEADICLMYTAHDAYIRKFSLWIPKNCTASRNSSHVAASLEFMKSNLKAETRPFHPGMRLNEVF